MCDDALTCAINNAMFRLRVTDEPDWLDEAHVEQLLQDAGVDDAVGGYADSVGLEPELATL